MFLSKFLVSKKGPLGAIWVAAYFFKKLKKDQIFDTNISSSVDNILQEQLEILAYRVLAYLLLGVVRIYSKKVGYLFDDCQELLININKFVVREKNREKEAARATCFSITRPVSFDLDAFDLEILEDTSGDNVVPREEITLKDVDWKKAGIRQSSLDRFAALDDGFLMDYTPTEDLSCHLMDFETEARTSHDVYDWEASMEKLRYDKSLHEEVSHLKTVTGVEENHMDQEANMEKHNDRFSSDEYVNLRSEAEEDPLGSCKLLAENRSNREKTDLSEPDNEINQAMEEDHVSILDASAEVPDIAGSKNHMEREGSREKCNDRFSSEGVNLHSEAEEEFLSSVKLLGEDQANIQKMNGPDLLLSENEVQLMEVDHVSILETNVEVPDIANTENHIGTEACRENNNDKFSQEKSLNLIAEVVEKSAGLIKPFGEEQTNIEMVKGLDRVELENEVHHVMEEDCNLGASMGKLQGEGFSHMDLEEPSPLVKPLGEEIQTGAEQVNFPAMTTSKDGKCQVTAKDHTLSVTLDASEEQTNIEMVKGLDRVELENEVHHVMEEDCNLGASIGKLQGEGFSHMDLEEPFPLVKPLGEEIQTVAEQVNFPAMTTSKDGKCQVSRKDHTLSVTLDATPRSMLQDASGATTPHFMLIPTPAIKERARFSRKRKCFFDDVIVFPNGIMRQWIKDASDLVSKRGKGGRTALAARKTSWYSNLPKSFSEPSVPCTSELKLLYCQKRLRLLEPIMKPPEKIGTSEPPSVGGSFEQAEIAPQTVEIRVVPDKLNLSESPRLDGSSEHAGIAPRTPTRQSPSLVVGEQADIAPETPVLHSKSLRPFESPENLKCDHLNEVGPSNVDPSESIEKEPSLNEIVEKVLSLNEIVEKEHFLSKDEDLDLNLEINSNEDDNQRQVADGWSMRSRMVAKQLQKSFLGKRKRMEKEEVKLLELLEGRTKKASARLFYEILVLKTKGVVDVKQDTAFGDILVLKVPQWDLIES
ncbi:hypothetical protein REPUB_Repub16aG0007400 [Reevesia pubescens]